MARLPALQLRGRVVAAKVEAQVEVWPRVCCAPGLGRRLQRRQAAVARLKKFPAAAANKKRRILASCGAHVGLAHDEAHVRQAALHRHLRRRECARQHERSNLQLDEGFHAMCL